MVSVAHLTSAHPRFDTRIFVKQCRSLAAAGYKVSLVVADGEGDAERDGVFISDVGKPKDRVDRMLGATRRVLKRALEIDADIYQFHDPELLPTGLVLKRKGKRVIFDSHEDVPVQILSKPYLHPLLRRSISGSMSAFESFACRRLDFVIAATPVIRDKFVAKGVATIDVNNFPILGELQGESPWAGKQREVCYIGGISAIRGIEELVAAMGLSRSGARLNLGGKFEAIATKAGLEKLPAWQKVNELGFLSRTEVKAVLGRSMAGIVTLHPTRAYLDSLPVKMFEYMSAGLPVIASDFPQWREVVRGNDCGVCVDPLDPQAIADAIDHLVENPDLARRMGENGRRAVQTRYNWKIENEKLLALYANLSSKR